MKLKKIKDYFTEEEVEAIRKNLEKTTKKNLEDSRIAQIKAVKKARETVLD